MRGAVPARRGVVDESSATCSCVPVPTRCTVAFDSSDRLVAHDRHGQEDVEAFEDAVGQRAGELGNRRSIVLIVEITSDRPAVLGTRRGGTRRESRSAAPRPAGRTRTPAR